MLVRLALFSLIISCAHTPLSPLVLHDLHFGVLVTRGRVLWLARSLSCYRPVRSCDLALFPG